MSVTFKILPDLGLVYIRYTGVARLMDTFEAFVDYGKHPQFLPGQKQLIDLSRVTEFEKDYVRLMELQRTKADTLTRDGADTLIAFYAPTPLTLKMAKLGSDAWNPLPNVVSRVFQHRTDAYTFLGVLEAELAALIEDA